MFKNTDFPRKKARIFIIAVLLLKAVRYGRSPSSDVAENNSSFDVVPKTACLRVFKVHRTVGSVGEFGQPLGLVKPVFPRKMEQHVDKCLKTY